MKIDDDIMEHVGPCCCIIKGGVCWDDPVLFGACLFCGQLTSIRYTMCKSCTDIIDESVQRAIKRANTNEK